MAWWWHWQRCGHTILRCIKYLLLCSQGSKGGACCTYGQDSYFSSRNSGFCQSGSARVDVLLEKSRNADFCWASPVSVSKSVTKGFLGVPFVYSEWLEPFALFALITGGSFLVWVLSDARSDDIQSDIPSLVNSHSFCCRWYHAAWTQPFWKYFQHVVSRRWVGCCYTKLSGLTETRCPGVELTVGRTLRLRYLLYWRFVAAGLLTAFPPIPVMQWSGFALRLRGTVVV